MLRRDFNLGLCYLALTSHVWASDRRSRGPLFWVATRGHARVFLMGFGDAKKTDESWLTPSIRQALRESSELWLEVAPPDVSANEPNAHEEYEKLGHEPPGRTLFDELDPRVRERVLDWMTKLGVKKESVESLRPWRAYYALNSAFWSRTKLPYESVNVDEVLRKVAVEQGTPVHYEMPSGVAFARFMAAMSAAAQSQYIEWLLDFFEEHRRGFDEASSFDWMTGHPAAAPRSLDRMRSMPQLYDAMQVKRNAWWAHKIDDLLKTDQTCFIGIGELHVLGPDGIPSQLRRLNVVGPSNLRENPSVEREGKRVY